MDGEERAENINFYMANEQRAEWQCSVYRGMCFNPTEDVHKNKRKWNLTFHWTGRISSLVVLHTLYDVCVWELQFRNACLNF